MLRKIPVENAKMFAKSSFLGNLTYSIPKIKPENLLKYQKLRFVTSSIEQRMSLKVSSDQQEENNNGDKEEEKKKLINPPVAYRIAASAASRRFSQSKTVIPFGSYKHQENEALMATADSVTAVVAAKEDVKEAVADDLKSNCIPPCEWFICDDDKTGTRFFIQGSDSLASWQANLLYSPMGKLLILQPSERFSPPHPLLPTGSGLYLLTDETEKRLRAAKSLL